VPPSLERLSKARTPLRLAINGQGRGSRNFDALFWPAVGTYSLPTLSRTLGQKRSMKQDYDSDTPGHKNQERDRKLNVARKRDTSVFFEN